MIKILVPQMACRVIDRAIQMFGIDSFRLTLFCFVVSIRYLSIDSHDQALLVSVRSIPWPPSMRMHARYALLMGRTKCIKCRWPRWNTQSIATRNSDVAKGGE
jgi:hypothetical protein